MTAGRPFGCYMHVRLITKLSYLKMTLIGDIAHLTVT
jgi:hypothetical protein